MRTALALFNHMKASLFWRTYLLNITLILTVLLICYVSASSILPEIAREQSKEMTDQAAQRVMKQTSVLVQKMRHIAEIIQHNEDFQTEEESELIRALSVYISPSFVFDSATVIDTKGIVTAAYPHSMLHLKGKDLGYRPYFSESLEKKKIFFSDVFMAETGRTLLVIGIPILNEKNEVKRVIALSTRLTENQFLHALIQNIDLGAEGYVYIVDQTGQIFSHPDRERIGDDANQNQVVQQLKLAKSGYQKVINTKGEYMYASYRFISGVNWGVVAQVPVESTYQALITLEKKVMQYLLIIFLPAMIFIGLYTRRIVYPIQQLHKAVEEVTKGNYEHDIPVQRNTSEIGLLSERFNQMIKHLRESREREQQSNRDLLRQRKFLRQVIDKIPNYIFARDQEGNFTLANQQFAQLFSTTPKEILGKNVRDFFTEHMAATCVEQDRRVMGSLDELFLPSMHYEDQTGQSYSLQVTKLPILSSDGQSYEVLTISTDITLQKQREQQMEQLAYYDTLTGLPNRTYFQERIKELLSQDPNREKNMAILFLDLDGFKNINDTLGHLKGDELLQEVARRLRGCLTLPHILARMGGDEFTILITDWEKKGHIEEQAKIVIDLFNSPFNIEGHEFHLTTSIGISIYPNDAMDMDRLIKSADTAMYVAKKSGKNTFVFYTESMSTQSWERLAIDNYLRKALEFGEFHLVYQPKKDLKTGKLTGMEALLRWENPHLGMVPPDKFVPIAEETGLIIPMGKWILLEACRQNQIWQELGYPPVRMAVNLSARQLLDKNLLVTIREVLDKSGLAPQWLELELTESTLMENADSVASILYSLKEMGIQISIDDFGTGYSSLSYLKRFPVNTIKIDRSFIQDIIMDEEDQAITQAILAMAVSLKLKVIAEGVETLEQLTYLKEQGCDEIQGFILSRPIRADEFVKFFGQEQTGKDREGERTA